MPEILTDDDIAARLAVLNDAIEADAMNPPVRDPMPMPHFQRTMELLSSRPEPPQKRYRYIRPFSDAAESLIDFLQNPQGRWMFGVREIDAMIRGVGRGELMFITGRAHSGKTQLVLQSICNNPNARVLYLTPDEVSDLVLMKLVAMTRGVDGESLERRIKDGDEDTIEIVRRVAAHDFRNLICIDEGLTFEAMDLALRECEEVWGAPADLVVIDYLELLPGDGEYSGVMNKAQGLKRWLKKHMVPVVCLHQASKTGAARGQVVDMDSMRFGGDDAATFVLGVYRKGEDKSMDETERLAHSQSVTVNVAKNKRPPSKKGEMDLWMDPMCGTIRSLPPGGVWSQGMKMDSPYQVLQVMNRGEGQ